MTDDAPAEATIPNPPPVLERMDRLSFQAYVGIGAAIGVLGLVLAWAIGPGASAGAPGGVAKAGVEAKAGAGGAAGAAGAGGGGGGAAGGGGADGGGGAAGGGGADGGGADGGGAGGADGGGAAEGGAAEDDAAADDAADGAAAAASGGADDGAGADAEEAADDGAEAGESGAGDDGAADAAGTTAGDEVVADDDEAADDDERSTSKSSSPRTHTPTSDPSGESQMTAEELLEEAKKALSEKRYRDAYRLATRSGYKKKSNETYAVKAKAACGMKDEASAKEAFKSLPMGDDRRKKVRDYCKEKGVRVGL